MADDYTPTQRAAIDRVAAGFAYAAARGWKSRELPDTPDAAVVKSLQQGSVLDANAGHHAPWGSGGETYRDVAERVAEKSKEV